MNTKKTQCDSLQKKKSNDDSNAPFICETNKSYEKGIKIPCTFCPM